MKGSKGASSKPLKVTRGGGKGTKTLGGSAKSMPAFTAKGVKKGLGNRF